MACSSIRKSGFCYISSYSTIYSIHHPHLFRQKLCVDPEIFDDILDLISYHPILHNQSNNPQLPVAIQLAIFLNHAGHYGNAISLEDVAQWAGVSVGTVVNCTHQVMGAILAHHDHFVGFPALDPQHAEDARHFVGSQTCPEWQNGIFAVDGSTIDLYAKVFMVRCFLIGNQNILLAVR